MPVIKVQLEQKPIEERTDRVVEVQIKDGDGEEYWIGIELIAHEFGRENDDVQISISKPSQECIKNGTGPVFSPNRVLAGLGSYHDERQGCTHSIWFEFHEIEGKKAVRNDP